MGLRDVVDVIHWCQVQIAVKFMRALCHDDDLGERLEEDPIQNDAIASAKVALLGLQRWLAAWHLMRQHLPEQGDKILDILLTFDRLRRRVEAVFHDAVAFVRSEFDTED